MEIVTLMLMDIFYHGSHSSGYDFSHDPPDLVLYWRSSAQSHLYYIKQLNKCISMIMYSLLKTENRLPWSVILVPTFSISVTWWILASFSPFPFFLFSKSFTPFFPLFFPHFGLLLLFFLPCLLILQITYILISHQYISIPNQMPARLTTMRRDLLLSFQLQLPQSGDYPTLRRVLLRQQYKRTRISRWAFNMNRSTTVHC